MAGTGFAGGSNQVPKHDDLLYGWADFTKAGIPLDFTGFAVGEPFATSGKFKLP
jgi:hypothetical protein